MKIIILILVCFIVKKTHGQERNSSFVESNQLNINPANCGISYKHRVTLNYRRQWLSVKSPFISNGFSTDHRLINGEKGFFSIGFSTYKSILGYDLYNMLSTNFIVSGSVKLNKKNLLGIGIQGGVLRYSLNTNNLKWGSQFNGLFYDPSVSQTEFTQNTIPNLKNFGIGIAYAFDDNITNKVISNQEKKLIIGFALDHINRPINSFSNFQEKLPIKYVLIGSSIFYLKNSKIAYSPSFSAQIQGNAFMLILGTKYIYKLIQSSKITGYNSEQYIYLGTFYRANDALIFSMGYKFKDFEFEFCYDVNVSKMSKFSNLRGAFEISIKYIKK